jgi:hypothetical protein
MARQHLWRDPWFCGTIDLMCEWMLNRWNEEAVPAAAYDRLQDLLLTPLRSFIQQHDESPASALQAAGVLFKALSQF